ncbi:MAG: DPP IV N-terminal domain-containing protein [Puniceicoccales bacterium]|jgi:dipeptidyl aminopeptidase/acylaminoacyl peptidase|nr:DPP IV N-terminal domain-containing protein [Puniceicoccales bacterium]
MNFSRTSLIVGACLLLAGNILHAQGTAADYERASKLEESLKNTVFKGKISPQWLRDEAGSTVALWYRNELPDKKGEFIFVDIAKGSREAAFDHKRLAEELGKVTEKTIDPEKLPFRSISFSDNREIVYFQAEKESWAWNRTAGSLGKATGEEMRMHRSIEPRASKDGGTGVTVNFINTTDEEIQCIWISTTDERIPYAKIKPGANFSQGTFAGHVWIFANKEGAVIDLCEASENEPIFEITKPKGAKVSAKVDPKKQRPSGSNAISPDGKWKAEIRGNNVWVSETKPASKTEKSEFQLTTDGTPGDGYTPHFYWSSDSKKLTGMRIQLGEQRKIYIVESSPADQLQPKLHTLNYTKPGDVINKPRPQLFDVEARKKIPVSSELFPNPWSIENVHWDKESSGFFFCYNQRGHQIMRVAKVDAATGLVKSIVEETSQTFIDYSRKTFLRYLDDTNEIIWMSERDGWNHLYLYDAASAQVKTQITKGEWVVKRIEWVDEQARKIWFFAAGINPGEDPYYEHLCRVDLDGSNFTVLTQEDGTHSVEMSPDRKLFVDTWSRVDLPARHQLRRMEDGTAVCELETADISKLLAIGWKMPERFAAKGRDGETEIYGIIVRPSNFDPGKKYPVLENIYAGPHDFHTPKSFGSQFGYLRLAELGFIVVRMDGMGTNWRSRAFHDVAWKNLADAGFPDRIAWLNAAAEKHPEMDISRMGIYGGSAGGQNALGALLFHGDFYKAAAADSGCHDNRMDKIWWNEAWMGWPVGPEYAEQSNVTNAHKLQGKLLLIVGELDKNVDPASTMQVANALIKADKDFEMLVIPGGGHCPGFGAYGLRRHQDFFVRALYGEEPRRP